MVSCLQQVSSKEIWGMWNTFLELRKALQGSIMYTSRNLSKTCIPWQLFLSFAVSDEWWQHYESSANKVKEEFWLFFAILNVANIVLISWALKKVPYGTGFVPVPGILPFFGLYRYRYRKKLVPEKSTGTGIGKIWSRKKVPVPVPEKILGTVTLWWDRGWDQVYNMFWGS